jgi:hypothetical protein
MEMAISVHNGEASVGEASRQGQQLLCIEG